MMLDSDTLTDITADVLHHAQKAIQRRARTHHGEYLACTAANILAVMLKTPEQDQAHVVSAVNALMEESGLPYRLRAIN